MFIFATQSKKRCPGAWTRRLIASFGIGPDFRSNLGITCVGLILISHAHAHAAPTRASETTSSPTPASSSVPAGSADATTQDNAPPPAAPTADDKKKAAEHFERGIKLYEDGDYSLALIEFERAYSYVTDYRVLFNIGQVSVQLGRYSRAVKALQQYLELGGGNIAKARIASVQEDLKMLEGRTAQLQIDCNVAGAEILLDDVRLGYSPMTGPRLVDAGEHRLTIQKPGYVTRTERLVLAGRDESNPRYELVEVPVAVVQPVQQPKVVPFQPGPTPKDPGTSKSSRTPWLYAGAGATGLFAVAWAVTGYIGIQAVSDLRGALQRPTTQGELDSLKSRARGALLASDILGAAALVTGGTTLYFTLTGPTKEQPKASVSRVSLEIAPSSVWVTGAF